MITRTHRARVATIRLVDTRIEELKERLRQHHDLGCALVQEIVRLEQSRHAYVSGEGGYGISHPKPVLLVRSA